ncbi:MAG: hypothetical protein LQ344_006102 [Seirophora lacunosa]|nr:MAG: hypothetical protein LQ344_006102 [Seirophora lacunosa]
MAHCSVTLQVFNALGFTYVLVISLVKASVLLLFYNLFGANKTMRYLIILGIGFAATTCVAFTVYHITALATCDSAATLSMIRCIEMNVGILCASVPAVPLFFRQHKLSLGALSSLRYRIFGKTSEKALQMKNEQKGKSFRGLELNVTGPSLGMKSKLGTRSKEYMELDENDKRGR